jgi:major inositol transporter-like SP family MFS transporter
VTTLGAAIGSMFSGPVLELGRWKCLMFGNVLCIVAAILSMIPNYPCLIIGRFVYGYAAGAFSVFCPKYISEVSPVEIKG